MNLVDPRSINISSLPCLKIEDKNFLPPCCAVYFVVAEDAFEIMYIGCSECLAKRWYQHSRRYDFAQMSNLLIYWYEVAEEDDQYEVEKLFIQYWNPYLNRPSDTLKKWWARGSKGYKPTTVALEPVLVEWAKHQPEGLSGLLRLALAEMHAKRTRTP